MTGNNGYGKVTRTNEAAKQAAELKKLSMKGLKLELDDLTNFIEEEILGKLVEITNAVEAHNEAFKIVSSNQAALQQSIDLLAGEIMEIQTRTPQAGEKSHDKAIRESVEELIQVRKAEPEPEPPHLEYPEPVPQEDSYKEDLIFGQHQHVVLETIADSCIVMNDILLLCKAMKKVPELTDQTRIALLDLAGRRAGIQITPGMQVRAGVKMIVA